MVDASKETPLNSRYYVAEVPHSGLCWRPDTLSPNTRPIQNRLAVAPAENRSKYV